MVGLTVSAAQQMIGSEVSSSWASATERRAREIRSAICCATVITLDWSGVSSSVAVVPITDLDPSGASSICWSIARTRTLDRTVSVRKIVFVALADHDHVDTVVRQDEAAGAGCNRDLGRHGTLADGSSAERMRDEESAIFSRRSGSPSKTGRRTTTPVSSVSASGRVEEVMKPSTMLPSGQGIQRMEVSSSLAPTGKFLAETRTSTVGASRSRHPGRRRSCCRSAAWRGDRPYRQPRRRQRV